MHMDVQRANLPPAIAAGSFESPPTAPTVNSQSHGTKKHQGEPGFITGLWRGWERRNTSSSCPEVKKNHPRGGPAMVCPVEHPSVFLSMERSSQHMFGVTETTTKESRSLVHPLSTSCHLCWQWKTTLLWKRNFWRALCSRSRVGCLFPHFSTHTQGSSSWKAFPKTT